MRGKNDCWIGLLRGGGIDIGALAFGHHPLDVVTEPAELPREKMSDRTFVSGYGLNVNELAGQSYDVDIHAVGKA